jgi:S-adenosylmethionine decarboxylase
MKKVLGHHWLIDLSECDHTLINDGAYLRETCLEAARVAQATIVTDVFHQFNPHGWSGVVVIAESHLALHTWPEHDFASVDIFSCSDGFAVEVAIEYLVSALRAKNKTVRRCERGIE